MARINPQERIGEKHPSRSCGTVEITNFKMVGKQYCFQIKFLDTGTIFPKYLRYYQIKSGSLIDHNLPKIEGIGFFGIGEYKAKLNGKDTICYTTWRNMMRRCYNSQSHILYPSYAVCTVHIDWHNFQNFATWFYQQHQDISVKYHIDKDIKIPGNKIYSADTCVLVPAIVNECFHYIQSHNSSGYPGVYKCNQTGKWKSQIVISGNKSGLGYFENILDAFDAYVVAKNVHIQDVLKQNIHLLEPCIIKSIKNWEIKPIETSKVLSGLK